VLGAEAPALKVVYVSYDGALDPLGSSQVRPYLEGLASRGVQPTLISFEKPERWKNDEARRALDSALQQNGIRWCPVAYHKRPRLPASAWDVLAGARLVRRKFEETGASLVHCRGDVAMAMARWARLPARARLLYDLRGLFADERVEAGSWAAGSLVDRIVRRVEAGNLRRADGVVALTAAGLEALRRRRPELPPHAVIPTCVDLSAFRPRSPGESPGYGLVYSGSLGTWYMAREMVAFARAAAPVVGGRTLFLTPDVDEARRSGATPDWADVRSVAPADVPAWLRRGRALFFFIRPTPSKRASCPTKLAEALASGIPVVCNRGVGDLDEVLHGGAVGVQLDSFTEDAYRRSASRLRDLLQDPDLSGRCRRLAEARYGLEGGVEAYHQLYRELCAAPPG
jgi:glycosyltransferase involved in cell wall biosynthesis